MPKHPMMQTPTHVLREVNVRLKEPNTSPNFRFILQCFYIIAQNLIARRKIENELSNRVKKLERQTQSVVYDR